MPHAFGKQLTRYSVRDEEHSRVYIRGNQGVHKKLKMRLTLRQLGEGDRFEYFDWGWLEPRGKEQHFLAHQKQRQGLRILILPF